MNIAQEGLKMKTKINKLDKIKHNDLMKKLRIKTLSDFINHVESGLYIPDFGTKEDAIFLAKKDLAALVTAEQK